MSTGPMKGTNNKIQTEKRQAYGYPDKELFELRILVLREESSALLSYKPRFSIKAILIGVGQCTPIVYTGAVKLKIVERYQALE